MWIWNITWLHSDQKDEEKVERRDCVYGGFRGCGTVLTLSLLSAQGKGLGCQRWVGDRVKWKWLRRLALRLTWVWLILAVTQGKVGSQSIWAFFTGLVSQRVCKDERVVFQLRKSDLSGSRGIPGISFQPWGSWCSNRKGWGCEKMEFHWDPWTHHALSCSRAFAHTSSPAWKLADCLLSDLCTSLTSSGKPSQTPWPPWPGSYSTLYFTCKSIHLYATVAVLHLSVGLLFYQIWLLY